MIDIASEQQRTFLELVTSAAKRLFNYMDIAIEDAVTHRLYASEVVDLTEDVSFMVVCPPAESSCLVPGQREMLLQRGDLLSLPLQVFEMVHLNTYQNSLVRKYSKLSCLLELDSAAANQVHREAFSNSEVAVAKERLNQLQDFQSKLNSVWRCIRWLMDVITFARDRGTLGISARHVLDRDGTMTNSPNKRTLLQIPPRESKVVKSTPGRGSWPGPGAASNSIANNVNLISDTFSKSEQHLSTEPTNTSQYLSAYSDLDSRKNSESSGEFNERMVPSKSEDMLFTLPVTPAHR